MKLIYGIEDKPKFSKTLVFAFQQMIAIMAATLLVPLLVTSYGLQADAAAALFGAGIGTIVYLFCTKRRSPVFLGSSFTFLGAYAATIGQNFTATGVCSSALRSQVLFTSSSVLSSRSSAPVGSIS